jgi:Rap1a immunity proteins
MRIKTWLTSFALCLAVAAGSARAAITEDSFLVRNTGDLIELCSTAPSDAMYTAASNFCHGFVVGVYRVLQVEDMAERTNHLFCMPNPAPTRNEAIANFVQWAKADAKRMELPPADGIATFMAQQYPCPRKR